MAKATKNQKISRAMQIAWREANRLCFNGKLPRPAFRVESLIAENANALWHMKGEKQFISVDPSAIKNATFLIRLMLHEMIHQLQWQQKSNRTKNEQHGRFFRRHAERIEKITGLQIFWVTDY
jgi:hypothetical protein